MYLFLIHFLSQTGEMDSCQKEGCLVIPKAGGSLQESLGSGRDLIFYLIHSEDRINSQLKQYLSELLLSQSPCRYMTEGWMSANKDMNMIYTDSVNNTHCFTCFDPLLLC